ncbi:acyltransferase family protein [Pedobacter steynii]|uniref:Acyltransferase 3 domain-containing protein n=1 Tax=Pedobacter steynii TaxID=430522 RepID=A0A1D7QBI9_9SPHI|nr:acyltransferase [Pedobacter steynii]AOM75934.1 hypothetical protein BFS30_01355 [Pedobacter steynii]
MVRVKELDVLRGIAALNVVLFHYTAKFRLNFGHDYPSKYDWNIGQYGVELFFIISGFVIFMSLQGKTCIRDFAYKRFSRLYPTYWICMILTFLVVGLARDPGIESQSAAVFLMNLTMIQGAFNIKNIDGVYWSLIPELFFYVSMGLLFQLGWLNKVRTIALVWLSLMLFNTLFKLPFGAYFLNLEYGMFFMAGILFYQIKFAKGDWHEHVLIGFCFLAAVLTHPGLTLFYVFVFIFLLFYLFVYDQLKFFSWRPFIFLGYISYSLYLLHQNIGFVLMRKMEPYIGNEYLVIFITMVLIVTLAWLVTRFLEKPVLQFLRNYRIQGQRYSSSLQK